MLYKEAVKAAGKAGSKGAPKGAKKPLLPEQKITRRYADGSTRSVTGARKGQLLVGTGAHGDGPKGPKRMIDWGATTKRIGAVPGRVASNAFGAADAALSRTGSSLKDMLIDLGKGLGRVAATGVGLGIGVPAMLAQEAGYGAVNLVRKALGKKPLYVGPKY